MIDLTGHKFGRWTVLQFDHKYYNSYWLCRCDCGTIKVVPACNLRNKNRHNQSCGCYCKEKAREICIQRNSKHGLSNTHMYHVWQDIKKRCFNPNNYDYRHYYGCRGITMYEPWKNDFQAFYDYVSKLEHFNECGYTLDRIDNNGNYEPNNIRWATAHEQAHNRRERQNHNKKANRYITINDVTRSVVEWSKLSGIKYTTLIYRLNHGVSIENILNPTKHGG